MLAEEERETLIDTSERFKGETLGDTSAAAQAYFCHLVTF